VKGVGIDKLLLNTELHGVVTELHSFNSVKLSVTPWLIYPYQLSEPV